MTERRDRRGRGPPFQLFPDKWDLESIVGKREVLEISVSFYFPSTGEHIILHYRLVFVVLMLPLSLLYDLWFSLRGRLVFLLQSRPSKHREKVAGLQREVREGRKVRINLVDILELDPRRRVVVCEPHVTLAQLRARLDRVGWTLPVLPELEQLTVGGLVMGAGIESSSHRAGLFQHICRSYELVLPDGSLVECSPQSDPELFYSIPWSYGTIGLLTKVEIEIVPSRRFVRLDYIPTYSLEQLVETLEQEVERRDGAQFLECLLYSRDQAVLITANMVDCCEPDKLNEAGLWYKPWFYKHAKTFFKTGPGTEYLPLRDYYHRHSRSMFWELEELIPFGNNLVFRYLAGWLMPPKVSLLKLTQGKTLKRLYESTHLVQVGICLALASCNNCSLYFRTCWCR